jgi:hypothetical protein
MSRSGIFAAVSALVFAGCASLQLEGVDFGWPVESALEVDAGNRVTENRYALVMPVGPLAEAEFGDSTALRGSTLRVLRSPSGHYYVTGRNFAHVYVFTAGDGALSEHGRIRVVPEDATPRGLNNPALNQRAPYVELLDDGARKALLSDGDVVTPDGANGGDR